MLSQGGCGVDNAVDQDRDATVVIIVKDEPAVASTLELLWPQCVAANAECIVVDASEGRLRKIELEFEWVRWIDFHQPAGRRFTIPQQRNVGVRAATTQRIVFCDAGVTPAHDWLRRLLDRVDADPASCWCGPIVSLDDPPLKTVCDVRNGAPIPLACTANMGFQRSLFEAVGGFNEHIDHGEDIDFGWRLEDAGHGVRGAADAVVWVKWGGLVRQVRRAFRYGHDTPKLLARNPRHAMAYCQRLPDTLLYPAWLVGLALALVASVKVRWVPLAWLAGLAIPLAKNSGDRPWWRFLLLKLVRAVGFLIAVPWVAAGQGGTIAEASGFDGSP